jgi:beta-phosphoglucomutase-like phosphatase (HAD superfamily)
MVIFDFDQTLVDTSPVEHLRAARNWKAVMAQATKLKVYDGVHELLKELHEVGERLAIVTKSPDMVARAFIREHKWPIDIVLGYHQVRARKPDPAWCWQCRRRASARRGLFTSVISRRTRRLHARRASLRLARLGA